MPIIISSKTRATKRTNTSTNTSTPNTSTFINHGYETVATLTSATTAAIDIPPPIYLEDTISTIGANDNDTNGNDIICNEDNGNHLLNSNRTKNEIRITENPISETVVC